ncbi:MAG: 50S ribosomal protein L21 [Candidatus Zixiibacteriota bacterium]|nr:MAG: 50S ribosomal protein L21 [candidate division Zixibacteria bacterium]
MYAVFESGGLQFNASEGNILKVPHFAAEPGENVSLDRVLLIQDGESALVGNPYLDSARVEAEVVQQGLAEKITVYKFKRRTKYRRTRGHRQQFTEIKIKKIISPEN